MKSVFFLLFAATLSIHSETLSLHAAQEKLLQGNPDLRIQKSELEKANAQLSEAHAAYYPSLDLSGSYQAFTKTQHIDLQLPAPFPPVDRSLGDHDQEQYGIDLSYPLMLGGGQRQQVLARRASLDAQNDRLHALENQMSLHLAAQYVAWNMAEASRQTEDSIVGYHREYLTRISALVKNGAALHSKELAGNAQLLQAEVELQAAEDLRDSIGRAATLMLGLSPNEPFAFEAFAFSSDSGENQSIHKTSEPTETRPELSYLEKTSTSLDHQEKAILSQDFPTVVGLVGYRVANPGLNLGSNAYMDYGLVGVQLRWNLFDGFLNQSQRAEMRVQRQEIQVEHERQSAFFQEAQLSAEKHLARLQQSQNAAQAGMDAARMNLTEIQTQHDRGAATDLDLLDARVQALKSVLQIHQLLLQQQLAEWQWRYARGENLRFEGD